MRIFGFLCLLSIVVQDVDPRLVVDAPATAWEIASKLTPPKSGIEVLNASLTLKSRKQAGLFHGGTIWNIDLASGAVLSSAWAKRAEGMNENLDQIRGDELGGEGFAMLDQLLPSGTFTMDACALRLDFKCKSATHDAFMFHFVFGSENYPTVGPNTGRGNNTNEDIMAAFLDGNESRHNIAVNPLTSDYVSVNTIYNRDQFYKDNDGFQSIYFTEMNGFTSVLTAKAYVEPGKNHTLIIAVADGGTLGTNVTKKAAWVFLSNFRCERTPSQSPSASPRPSTSTFSPSQSPTFRGSPRSPAITSLEDCATYLEAFYECGCGDTRCLVSGIKEMCQFPRSEVSLYIKRARKKYKSRFCQKGKYEFCTSC